MRKDAEHAIERVKKLRANGYAVHAIAKASGLGERSVWHLASGKAKVVRQSTIDALDAVPDIPRDSKLNRVKTYRARRRLEALMVNGYSLHKIAIMSGAREESLGRILRSEREFVTAEMFEKIDVVFSAYSHLEEEFIAWREHEHPYIQRTKDLAARRGFRHALEWEFLGGIDVPKAIRPAALRK